ncbi:MAG: LacI family DNA-binding transcriptional regulator [Acidobacteria bacterium]|nr:LacI family DNA-binding transcriptional regulator [Acidobacteriota bacterium]
MITIREVAQRAKVSVGTVSNVLAGSESVRPELRRRVEQAMRELDYQPNEIARSLKTRQTKTLGAVVSDLTNPFYPMLLRGAEDAALARGYLLFILNTDDRAELEQRALSLLRARKVDGILLVTTPGSDVESTLGPGFVPPVVFVDRTPSSPTADYIVTDNRRGARMCTNHLVSRGHRRIGFVSGSTELSTGRERLDGYLEVLRQAGIEPNPVFTRHGEFRLEPAYRITKELLLESSPPTAIFAANSLTGLGALKAIHELGLRCPQDISLAVFDDVPFADVIQPRLTSIAQPAYEMGRLGAEVLIARIEEKERSAPKRIELAPELNVRESTGPAPR